MRGDGIEIEKAGPVSSQIITAHLATQDEDEREALTQRLLRQVPQLFTYLLSLPLQTQC